MATLTGDATAIRSVYDQVDLPPMSVMLTASRFVTSMGKFGDHRCSDDCSRRGLVCPAESRVLFNALYTLRSRMGG